MSDQLFEEWQVYEKLLIHDYMDHRAFFERLQAEILSRFECTVTILDLGCGDLSPVLSMPVYGFDRNVPTSQCLKGI